MQQHSLAVLWFAMLLSIQLQPGASNPPGCECLVDNLKLGEETLDSVGKEYGTWCAAWDDGICTPFKTSYEPGEHPCEGTDSGGCEVMWPELNWQVDQARCCDAWCYVSPECNASDWGIDLEESWLTLDSDPADKMYFSYGACPDWRTRSNYPPDGSKDLSQYSYEDCPYRPWPVGCNCVGENYLLGDDRLLYGWDYGKWCASWEDDICHPNATATDAPHHTCNGSLAGTCATMWPASDWTSHQFWCCDSWCYVNSTCDQKKHGIDKKPSWVTDALQYSYGACADFNTKPTPRGKSGWLADWAQYRAKVEGCECIGDNRRLGATQLDLVGPDYGKWCAAWDDGLCSPATQISPDNPHTLHTCGGTLQAEESGCELLWGDTWNFSEPQLWCCSAWCYIDKETCTPELQQLHGINVAESWVAQGLYYSYEACFDTIIRPSVPSHGPLDYAQYDKDTCPYRSAVPGFVAKKEVFVPITEPFVKQEFDIYIQQNNKSNQPQTSATSLTSPCLLLLLLASAFLSSLLLV